MDRKILLAQLHSYGNGISLEQLINGIKNATWIIFTIIVVVSFVMAGILFLTANGEPEKIKTARMAFFWGIAGVAVGILAFGILSIVGGLFH